jgi:hypothetical protein
MKEIKSTQPGMKIVFRPIAGQQDAMLAFTSRGGREGATEKMTLRVINVRKRKLRIGGQESSS